MDYLLSLNCRSLRDVAYQQYILSVHTGKNLPARGAGAENSPSYNLWAVAVVVAQQ